MNEDFLLELETEDIQDFSSIFKIDLLSTLSEAIKRQISLNKDYDVVWLLESGESEMETYGAKYTLDLDEYRSSADNFKPTTPVDIFKSVVPYISMLMGKIHRNYQMYPTYMIAGLKTAAMLRTLQSMMMNFPGKQGEMGFSGETAQFMKLKILEAASAQEGKIYLSIKPSQNNLEKSCLIDLVYQPLYIVKEITDGATRNYVRARTMTEMARYDGVGCIDVQNLDKYLMGS